MAIGREERRRVKAVDGLALIDETYAANRRETWTRLLTSDGEPDIESIEETLANLDRAFAEERALFVAWLDTLHEGGPRRCATIRETGLIR